MLWVRVPPEQLFFIFYGKGVVQDRCIGCFDLCRSKSFHVNSQLGVGVSYINYSGPLLDVRPIALDLYCFDSTELLSCLGSLVVEHLPSKQYVVGLSPT